MSDVNIPLLRKAVEWAEAEAMKPEIDCAWAQHRFISEPRDRAHDLTGSFSSPYLAAVAPHCGTAFCVAGYIGQLLDPRYAETSEVANIHVSEFAARALGLPADYEDTVDDEHNLFGGGNDIADVRRIAEDLAGERL